jgi:endonuclease-3 related protein
LRPSALEPSHLAIYERLRSAHGPRGWWPGESAFEIAVGAILVQNTAWVNVEKALAVLREKGQLSFAAMRRLEPEALAPLIRSSGYFNVKARRLLAFVRFLEREYGGRIQRMQREERLVLRAKLLAVPGIGPETADSIALYAAGHPVFVVDAYTRRIFGRLGFMRGDEPYEVVRERFESALPPDAALYNDYHAQIVHLGKDFCRTVPRCPGCCLADVCRESRRRALL